MQNSGHQCINCSVKSCKHNDSSGCCCTLTAIDIKPRCDCSSGKACDETNCSTYVAK